MDSSIENEMRRLRWDCRRGIKEVEVILEPFFERHYASLSAEQKIVFQTLLDQQDVDLFEWVTERCQPESKELSDLVKQILKQLAADAKA